MGRVKAIAELTKTSNFLYGYHEIIIPFSCSFRLLMPLIFIVVSSSSLSHLCVWTLNLTL